MIPLGTLAGSRYAPTGRLVLTSDSFNRANGDIRGDYTDAALGGTPLPWKVSSPNRNANFIISSNQLGLNTNTDVYAYAAVDVGVSSMVVSFRIGSGDGGDGLVIFASGIDANVNSSLAYELYISDEWGLSLGHGDEYDSVASTPTSGDIVELVSDYPDVSVRVNGVTVLSITDTSGRGAAPGTYAGIRDVDASLQSRVDDFKVEGV